MFSRSLFTLWLCGFTAAAWQVRVDNEWLSSDECGQRVAEALSQCQACSASALSAADPQHPQQPPATAATAATASALSSVAALGEETVATLHPAVSQQLPVVPQVGCVNKCGMVYDLPRCSQLHKPSPSHICPTFRLPVLHQPAFLHLALHPFPLPPPPSVPFPLSPRLCR